MASSNPPGLLGDLQAEDLNDACCWACSGGGDVVCCDGCRAVYHLACIGLSQLPEDDWFCPLCHCKECSQPCRSQDGPLHIDTKFVEVQQKPLQPRQHAHQRLPTCPGYLCPQQVRQWLQSQPSTADAAGTAGAAQDSSAKHEEEEAPGGPSQPRAKRQKAGDTGSSSGSVSPSGNSSSSFVRCCGCQAACHVACLPAALRKQYMRGPSTPTPTPTKSGRGGAKGGKKKDSQQQQQQQQPVDPYFCSPACQQVATHLANRCAQGVMQVDALADGTPVSWQLIQPAAVAAALAAPADSATVAAAAAAVTAAFGHSSSPCAAAAAPVGLLGTGIAAGYSQPQAEVLAQVLRDALQLMSQQLGPAWEVRSFQNALPWLLGGLRASTPGGLLDLSHFHVAVLWVGSTLAAAALVRLHGVAVLEVSLAATLQQLQHKQLGRLLVACVERFALETCKVRQAWMPTLGGVVKPCVGVSVLPSWERPAGARDPLQPAAGSTVQLLGLGVVKLESPPAAAGTGSDARQQPRQLAAAAAQQQNPKDLKSCWALQLKYGPAPTVVDWLQLPKHMLLRYSYVPFVTKRLSPETLVPLPRFNQKQAKAGPASAEGGSPPGAAARAGPGPSASAGAGGAAAAVRGGSSGGAGGGGGVSSRGHGGLPPGHPGSVASMAGSNAARQQQQQQLMQQQEILERQQREQREHQRQQQLLLEQQRRAAEQQLLQQQQQQWLLQTQQHVQQLQQQRTQQQQVVLRPHLQQLPPRVNNSQVLGQQQQEGSREKQQSLVPPATPGIAAGIADGIIAYNRSASRVGGVVGISGVGAGHAATPKGQGVAGDAHMH